MEAGFVAGIPRINAAPVQPGLPATINAQTGEAYANAMQQYDTAMNGWRRTSEDNLRYSGRRFGVGLATAETRDLLSNFLLPAVLREDPRYEPASLDLGFGSRLGAAAESIFVTRNDNGRLTPNFSKWIGTAGAAVIAKHLYADRLGVPELDSNQFVWRYIFFSLAGDEATNLAHELVRGAVRQDLQHLEDHGPATEENYYPLSAAGTFVHWARSTYSPRNFVQGALIAGMPNIPGEPAYPLKPVLSTRAEEVAYANAVIQYGADMETWRRGIDESVRYHTWRFVAGFSESETQQFLSNLAFPLALRMDPRYIPAGSNRPIAARIGDPFEQLAVSRTNAGTRVLNIPLLAGTIGSAFIAQQIYYPQLGLPELENGRVVGKTIGLNLAADLLLNMVHEFSPRAGF